MKKENIAIRWHSRAGQGAITAANYVAENALKLGLLANSFPDFGAEKRGAAVQVFNKISTNDKGFIENVSQPQIVNGVVLFDKTLATAELGYDKIIEGLGSNGFLLVNTTQSFNSKNWPKFGGKVYHIAGSKIALEIIKRDIPNVTIVGALVNILKMDRLKSRENLKDNLSKFFPENIIEMNLLSFDRGFEEVEEVF